jgi:N-acetylmuramoyl-L-alanine amidase
LTNPLEEEFLGSANGQEYLAKALFRGIRKYKDEIEGRKNTYNDEFENQTPLENENIKAGNMPPVKKAADDEQDQDSAAISTTAEVISPSPELLATNTETKEQEKVAEPEVEDTATSAKEIAEKFKKDTNKEAPKKDLPKKEVLVNELPPVKLTQPKNDIVFKVQVASSDVPLNLKQQKFSYLIDADFYKMGKVMKYTSGKFVTIKDAVAHQTFLREKGFADCFLVAFKNGQRIDMTEARKQLEQK